MHTYESVTRFEHDYGHIGYESRATPQLLETHPTTRIRRTRLRTSAQWEVTRYLDSAPLRRIQEKVWVIWLSSFPHAVHGGYYFPLGIQSCMDTAKRVGVGDVVDFDELVWYS